MSEGTKKLSSAVAVTAKGGKLNRAGRKPGVPNKTTVTFRETINKLLESNAENIGKWLQQIAEGTPAVYDKKGNLLQAARPPDVSAALQRLGYLAEFAAPRLSRQEQVGDGGGPITVVIRKESET